MQRSNEFMCKHGHVTFGLELHGPSIDDHIDGRRVLGAIYTEGARVICDDVIPALNRQGNHTTQTPEFSIDPIEIDREVSGVSVKITLGLSFERAVDTMRLTNTLGDVVYAVLEKAKQVLPHLYSSQLEV